MTADQPSTAAIRELHFTFEIVTELGEGDEIAPTVNYVADWLNDNDYGYIEIGKPKIVRNAAYRPRMLTRRARAIATLAHHGQVDKVGEPYINHPTRVAEAVSAFVGDGEAVQVAFLHDVVEDTPVTLDDLRDYGFSTDVIAAVDAITKRKGESFADYYERVKANRLAVVVKWHDVADNADPARLAKVAPDTQERLRSKYERAKAALCGT